MATIKDKIGLAMLPSAQSGGASTSTTDFSGTVHSLLPIQYTGPNLVKNGTFDTNSDWVLGSWTIENGVANGNGVASFLTQDGPIEEGKRYLLTYEIKNYVSGSIRWRQNDGFGNFVNGNNNSGNGIYTEIIKPNNESVSFQSLSLIGSIDNIKFQLISNGDFDFERSSSATRVGSDGYIKNVEVLSDELVQNGDFEDIGSELVTNGTFDTDSDWTKQTGWSISGGSANYDFTTNSTYLRQTLLSGGFVSGKSYRINFEITDGTAYMNIKSNAETLESTNLYSTGSYSIYVTASANGSDLLIYGLNTQGTAFSIDNISVKEVGQNWTVTNTDSTHYVEFSEEGARFVSDTTSPILNLGQGISLTSNKKYRFSIRLRNNGGTGNVKVQATGLDFIPNILDGTYTQDVTPTQNQSSVTFYRNGANVDLYIEEFSIVEITDDTDIPRLDFSNAAQPSLLLEPERTNEIQYSEGFSQWTNNNTTDELTSSTLSPEGRYNAYKIIEASSGVTHKISSGFVTTGLEYTISVFAKAAERSIVSLGGLGLYTNNEFCQYDLINGTAINTGTTNNASVSIENYGNGWYRCIATYTATGTSGVNISLLDQLYTGNATSGEGQVYQGDSTKGVYIYGAQLEEGSYATSYIPTNGETNGVTRNADVCNNAGDSTIFNDAEGVLYAEIKFNETTTNSSTNGISLNDGSPSNRVTLYNNTNNVIDIITPRVYKGGSSVIAADVNSTANPPLKPSNQYNKIAVKYDSNGLYVYANGSFLKERTGFDCSFPEGTLKSISFDEGGNEMEGSIRSVLYFPEALSDTELERLTSSDITQVLRNYNRRGELLGATYESAHVQTKLNELF